MTEGKKRVTVDMSEDTHRDLKMAAFMAGKSLKDIILEGAEQARKMYAKEIKKAKDSAE